LALIRINICDDTFAYSNKVLHTTTASQFVWFISFKALSQLNNISEIMMVQFWLT